MMRAIILTAAAAVGACIGSFIGVVVDRLPKGKSFVTGHSICPACGRRLSAGDKIPVFSYVLLKGRCRSCGWKIPGFYLIVELFGAGMALLSIRCFSLSIQGILAFAASQILFAAGAVDAETMEIPVGFDIALLVVGIFSLFFGNVGAADRLIGAAVIAVPLFFVSVFSGAFGMGDVKLCAAAGFLIGWQLMILAFFIAVVVGGIAAVRILIRKKDRAEKRMAFGPYLSAGIITAMFFGEPLISFYLGMLV